MICRPSVTAVQNDLWRQVKRRSTESVGLSGQNLGETKVNHDWVAISVNHYVLGLQISVHDGLQSHKNTMRASTTTKRETTAQQHQPKQQED